MGLVGTSGQAAASRPGRSRHLSAVASFPLAPNPLSAGRELSYTDTAGAWHADTGDA